MAFQTAPHIPFHPAHCPRCRHYAAQIERCRAYVTDSVPRPLLGVFSGESEESCPRFSLQPAAPAASEAPAPPTVNAAATAPPVVSAATAAPTIPEARIHCPKCQHENPTHLLRCSVCNASLLPGESLAFRLAVFVVSLAMSGFFGWLAYRLATTSMDLPGSLSDPYKFAFIAVVLPFAGLVTLLRRTPRFTRYANRAERHVSLNLRQAAADFTQALELAPEKEHAGLLRKRAAVFEKLGQSEDAIRDLIAVTYADGAYQGGASLTSWLGGDPDTYALSRAKGERLGLVSSGRAVLLGYCPACKDAVQLTGEMRCPAHPRAKPRRVRLVVPSDVADASREIRSGKKRHTPRPSRDRTLRLAIGIGAVAVGYLVLKAYVINPQKQAAETPTSQAAIAELASTPAVTTVEFDDQGVSFDYPSGWELIGTAERRILLNSTLEGLGEYDYIGGVYLNGADSCRNCAQMTLVLIPLPGISAAMDAEQYSSIKANAEGSMGSRLLEHQFVTIDGIPAASSKYIGRSRKNQLWDIMLVIPGSEQALMFSCSAQPDAYAEFEPVFTRAMESLSFAFAPDEPLPEPGEAATAEPASPALTAARVKGNAVNVRAGPGKEYDKVGRLPGDSAIQVVGRDESGGWLKVVEPPGWVSAELVDLPVAIDALPVIRND